MSLTMIFKPGSSWLIEITFFEEADVCVSTAKEVNN